ncbi:MAG: hypothetical protein GF308_06295 [Candidatus Heimdallarchaeota archaeon]|nr:hypothetical protein [Candidatus Heimdallarchaeota archaeon]
MADINIIISSIFLGLFFLLFSLMVYQSIRKQRKAYLLTISLFLGSIGGIISIFDIIRDSLGIQHRYFLFLALVIASISYYLIYLFFEQLIEERPNRIRLVIASIFLFSSIIFNQLFFYFAYYSNIETSYVKAIEILWDISYDALGLFIFIFGAYVHFKSYHINKEWIPLVQAISLIFISIGFIFGFLSDVISLSIPKIGDILKIVGIVAFSGVYIVRIDYIYRLPVNVYFILIFTQSGLNIHISQTHLVSEEVDLDVTEKQYDEKLLSGVITAISNLLKESLGSREQLEKIVSGDREIILDSGEIATCAILCDRSTFFLHRSLVDLRKSIEKKYKLELTKTIIHKADFIELSTIIQQTFPFLVIEEV